MARQRLKLRSATKLKLEKILRFELIGKKPKEIAELMGMAVSSITELIRHAEYGELRERMVERVYADIGPVW